MPNINFVFESKLTTSLPLCNICLLCDTTGCSPSDVHQVRSRWAHCMAVYIMLAAPSRHALWSRPAAQLLTVPPACCNSPARGDCSPSTHEVWPRQDVQMLLVPAAGCRAPTSMPLTSRHTKRLPQRPCRVGAPAYARCGRPDTHAAWQPQHACKRACCSACTWTQSPACTRCGSSSMHPMWQPQQVHGVGKLSRCAAWVQHTQA